jgi:outer membrane biosynthesis protein TonB
LRPQIIKRVHELYEEIGREEVRAVQEWEKAEGEIRRDETKAEPEPEAKAAEPKPDAKVAEPKPEVKVAEPKPDAKAAEPKSEAKAAKPKFEARNKIIFTLSIIGLLAALVAAYLFGRERKAQPPRV